MSINISGKDSVPNVDIAMLYGASGKAASDETSSDVNVALLEDAVEISEEANTKSNAMQDKLEEMRNRHKTLTEELEKAREMGEGVAEAWKEKIRCLQIAMRIISGNKVPEADVKYLQEKDPELYSKSITMRVEKQDPKEHDRLSEDEEEKAEDGSDGIDRSAASSGSTEENADVQTDAGGEAAAEIVSE